MDKVQSMKVFASVAENQSFVEAARKLEITAPSATRAVAQLERGLGVRLFNRTTRQVRLTDVGARFFEDTKRILEDIDQAEAAVTGSYKEPVGLLSVTAPVMFGQKYIVPILTEFLELHPSVEVKSVFYDRVGNILDEGLDIAIRIGHLKDSSLYAIQVGSVKRVVCGSPDYLREFGVPNSPQDLSGHRIIQASPQENSMSWKFKSPEINTLVKFAPRMFCNQNGSAIQAAKLGFGLTRVLSYQIGQELQDGSLVPILEEHEVDALPVSIVHLEGRRANAKVRAFVDLAVARLRSNPFFGQEFQAN
ncbi:MAG: LysR family transcriptional regulator [Pseudomonadota bacterium]